jgi:DNA-binding CsgD family transcriptional regulator
MATTINQANLLAPCLTETEKDVLYWFAEGKTAKEVAVILNKSVHTVMVQRHSIMQKFGATNMVQAVVIAVRKGLL